ncbi:MAG TPA: ABC transporter transmembrane domain-containing protein, partial [Membranihabitans sp.]|nr:ABC transporter transmembrane domain-containing protein [Membranihabitans sp.]
MSEERKNLWHLVVPYKWYFAGNIFSNVLVAIFTLVSIPILKPFFDVLFDQVELDGPMVDPGRLSLNNFIDFLNFHLYVFVETQGHSRALLLVCLVLVLSFLLKNVFRYLSMVFMAFMRNGVVRDIREMLYRTLLQKPLDFYKSERKGNLLTVMSSDVIEFESSVLSVLETIIRSPMIVIGSLGYMVYVSPTLTLYVMGLMVFTVVVIGGLSRKLKRQSRESQDLLGSTLSITEETVYGIKTIRAFHAQQYVQGLFSQYNEGFRKLRNRILYRKDLASPLSEFLGVTVVTVLLWLGSNQVFSGELDASTFLTFIYAFYNIIEPAKAFSSAYYNYQKGMGAWSRIQALVDREMETQLVEGTIDLDEFRQTIQVENVSFT